MIIFIEHLFIDNIDQKIIEYSSNTLFTMFNCFLERFNYKYAVTLTKFIMDIKKMEGTEQKKTRTTRNIILDIDKIKIYLNKKFKVTFTEEEDEPEKPEKKSALDM